MKVSVAKSQPAQKPSGSIDKGKINQVQNTQQGKNNQQVQNNQQGKNNQPVKNPTQ